MKVVLQKGVSPGQSTGLSTLVVLTAKDLKTGKIAPAKLSPALNKLLGFAQDDASFCGDKKEQLFFRRAGIDGFDHVLFVGLGDSTKLNAESFRVAGAIVFGALKAHKVTSAGLLAESLLKFSREPEVSIPAFIEGIELSDYTYDEFKSSARNPDKKAASKPRLETLSLLMSTLASPGLVKAIDRAHILVECQKFVRRLGDTPGNFMTPTLLADEAVKAAKGTGLKVTVWDKSKIEKEKFGGLLAVARGSAEEPRFIVMEYNGGSKGTKPVCFVGKGITFDTGGISLKPGAAMEEMKYDMCGGAAVIGTMVALAKLKAKVNVIGLVAAAENMPGSRAFKPGDVYIARNGKSVEVFNTDAEGRLVLGDALAYGSEREPIAMFDAATLTGAILIALGNTHTGVFTRDTKLMKRIQEASDVTGELVWPMPLLDFHVEDMKGIHADLANIPGGRLAGSSTAAGFLEEFVSPGIPWAHFDIAGTAQNVGSRFAYHPKKGGSGMIMRTFVEIAESY